MILDSYERIDQYNKLGAWGQKTLLDFFSENVASNPDREALVDPINREILLGSFPRRYTYAQLERSVNQLSLGFLEMGVKKDDLVLVQLPNIVELAICYLALGKIGAVISPVPVQYRRHELSYILEKIKPRAFITIDKFNSFDHLKMAVELKSVFPSIQEIIVVGEGSHENAISFEKLIERYYNPESLHKYLVENKPCANDIVTLCWTSGTEAEPKGCPRSHNQWIAITTYLYEASELKKGDDILLPFPFVNLSAIIAGLVPWLFSGGKLVLHHPFDSNIFIRQLSREKVSYAAAPPAVLIYLLKTPDLLSKSELKGLRRIASGSAPLSSWMIREYQERYGIIVVNIYGSNEGALFGGGYPDVPDPTERAYLFPRWGATGFRWRVQGTQFIETKLIDPLTKSVVTQKGKPGELYYKGPGVFPGYYKRDDLNEKSFDGEGFFKTGDLFAIEGENLDRYRFCGRVKDLIIRGGQNISSEEIENLLQGHPAVEEVAAIGVPDQRLGERTCVYVVPKANETITLENIVTFLKEKDIAVYKLPEILEIIDKLPRNPVGKVLKNVLREDYQRRNADHK